MFSKKQQGCFPSLLIAALSLFLLVACNEYQNNDINENATDSGEPFEPAASMIVVTTNHIRDASLSLYAFILEKKRRHIRVLVATEDDFGGADLVGVPKAIQIRTWLQTVYEDYQYLLLIGDPHPEYGDTPFLNAQVYMNDPCEPYGYNCTYVPTDSFYADLDGDWDVDDDGIIGEWGDDYAGINFDAELITGRIPVYFHNIDDLDSILDTAISYMNTAEDQLAYRKKTLIPATISFYEDELYLGSPRADGAGVVKYLERVIQSGGNKEGNQYSIDALVEKDGIAPSTYNAPALTRESLIDTWSQDYGVVYWIAHGWLTGSARTIWVEDKNNNGRPDKETEYATPWMIENDDFPSIRSAPGFVYMGSCYNASPKSPENMAYSALRFGVAVGVGASTQPAYAGDIVVENFEPDDVHPYAFTYGAYFTLGLINGAAPAQVLAEKKATLGNYPESKDEEEIIYNNKLMLNYFGDPTLTLNNSIADIDQETL